MRRANRHVNPAGFQDAAAHEAAVWDAGGPSPRHDYNFGSHGEKGQLLAAVWGNDRSHRDAADAHDLAASQAQRPDCFVRKLPNRVVKPFPLDLIGPRASLVSVDEFASQYAAADFAERSGLLCDTSVTLQWSLLGHSKQVEARRAFRSFQKCLGEWLDNRDLPVAYFYVHEAGSDGGLHTHMQIHVPLDRPGWPNYGPAFRTWAKQTWVRNQAKDLVPRAVNVSWHNRHSSYRHWIGFHYQMKGYDSDAVVVAWHNRNDARAILLGDLIAFPWRNPGVVTEAKRVGCSQALGPAARRSGVPTRRGTKVTTAFEAEPSHRLEQPTCSIVAGLEAMQGRHLRPERGAFQSMYEAGVRDVRDLYDTRFVERVTRLPYDFGRVREVPVWNLQEIELL